MSKAVFARVTATVEYRSEADWGVDAAYIKGTARIYPEQWSLLEMRAILADMERRRGIKATPPGREGG